MSQMRSYISHPLPTKEVAVRQANHRLRQQLLFSRLEAARQNSQYSVNAVKRNMNSV